MFGCSQSSFPRDVAPHSGNSEDVFVCNTVQEAGRIPRSEVFVDLSLQLGEEIRRCFLRRPVIALEYGNCLQVIYPLRDFLISVEKQLQTSDRLVALDLSVSRGRGASS